MQLDWQHLAQVVIESLAAKVAVVIAGVLAVQVVGKAWDRYRYGGWYVVITQGGQRVLNYGVSVAKSKQVQVMPEELPVFLKGKVSPYAWLNCDLDHKDCQMLKVDRDKRTWTIDLDKNPDEQTGPARPTGRRG